MFINSFNHFRAIAIISIVSLHTLTLVGVNVNSVFDRFLVNLLSGGTSLFVFISGFLFYHIFYERFNYQVYLLKKVKVVILPYITLGLLPVLHLVLNESTLYGDYFLSNDMGFVNSYLIPAFKYYATGRFMTAYWYIPFVAIVFLLSPLFIYFSQARMENQIFLIILLSIIAMLVHRPVLNINPLQSFVYFVPVYLLGIFSAVYKERIYHFGSNREQYLLWFVIAIAIFQSVNGVEGNSHKEFFKFQGLDMMYLQKTALCLFFMIYLHRFENVNNAIIDIVASTSFTIFFLHPFIIVMFKKLGHEMFIFDSWLILFGVVAVIVFLSILVALCSKRLLLQRSRYVIGY